MKKPLFNFNLTVAKKTGTLLSTWIKLRKLSSGFRPCHAFVQNDLTKTSKIGFAETFASYAYQIID